MESAAPPMSTPQTATSIPHTAAGTALEPRVYTDPSLLESEQELIFERTWQLAGHVSSLPRPGSYLTARAGTQPVLVVRGEQHQLHAFKNICRHRGSRLLSGSGQCKAAIRCRYHGWTYRLDGSLIGIPEGLAFDEPVDKAALGLMPARVEELCGLVFVNLDPNATPLSELVGDLPERLAPYRIETLEPFSPSTGSQPANWKAVADNYLEGYHIPLVHRELARSIDVSRYEVEVHEDWVLHRAPPRDGTVLDGRWLWRWPNLALNVYDDAMNLEQFLPLGPDRTCVAYQYLSRDGTLDEDVSRLSKLLLDEDAAICEAVQRNLDAGVYRGGVLSARHEGGVARFQDLVRAAGAIS